MAGVERGALSDSARSRIGVLSAATADRMRNWAPWTRIVEFAGIGLAPWLMGNDQTDVICDFLFAADAQIAG